MEKSASSSNDELKVRTKIRGSLRQWAEFALARHGRTPAKHHLLILDILESLAEGETKQLMLLLPPGSAKSTYASLLFPPWWLARYPATSIITASHTASLAQQFGRGVRDLLMEHSNRLNVRLRPDIRSAGRFCTEQGGDYFAIGVHGAVTGRRADLAIIDDPISSFLDAESAAARDRLWNWYRAELVTRLKPNARTALIMNRWHPDDLAARLLNQGGWTVLRLPALADAIDPLEREPGDALWPEWEDRKALLAKQASLGERCFAALFQQAPLAENGRLFDISQIRLLDSVPNGASVRAWDLAATRAESSNPDWTAGVRLLRDEFGGYVIEDICHVRVSAAELSRLICDVAAQDGAEVTISLPKDPGQAGIYQVTLLTRMLAGYRVTSSPEVGSKKLRAEPVAAQIATGNLHLRRAAWNQAFLDELVTFPHGDKDDQVDALSRAFNTFNLTSKPARYTLLSFIGR